MKSFRHGMTCPRGARPRRWLPAGTTIALLLTAALGAPAAVIGPTISTIAGTGSAGYSGDGGTATSAQIQHAISAAVDSSNNVYFSDRDNHRIRMIAAVTGTVMNVAVTAGRIYTVAGNGTGSYSGDGGQATSASINYPYGIALDSAGNLYIADRNNNRIRKVTASTGVITTVAGNGTGGYSGNGAQATSANISQPRGVSIDTAGNIYFVEDSNATVRKVTVATGIISAVVGTVVGGTPTRSYTGDGGPATDATINWPGGLAVDGSGNIYIADKNNHVIRKVDGTTGIISTVVGNGTSGSTGDGGLATAALLNSPQDVAADGDGNFYIADSSTNRIRKVTVSTGIITTVAGNGSSGYGADGVAATSTSINIPYGVAVDPIGTIYIPDNNNYRIRKVTAELTVRINNIPASPAYNGSFTPTYLYNGDGTPSVTSSTLSVCTVSAGAVSFIATGTCTLTPAATAGSTSAAITGNAQSFTVGKATTTISVSNAPAIGAVGGSFTASLSYAGDGTTSISSSTPTVCSVSGNTVSFLATGTCTLTASATEGTNYNAVTGSAQNITAAAATSTVTVTCSPSTRTYTGSAITPCTAGYTTNDGLSGSLTVTYTSNVDPGTVTASSSWAGDTIHPSANGSATFTITQAPSTVTVTCSPSTVTYTGSALTPCTAGYTTTDGLSDTLTVTYSNNTDAGTASASAVYSGDANHVAGIGSASFTIAKATSTVTVTCSPTSLTYTGSALTPCTAGYTTSDGLSGSPSVTYSSNTNAGTASGSASYAGDANHAAGTGSATFTITKATSTVTVTCSPSTVTYTGSALTPCTAGYTTSDGLSGSPSVTYSNNTNAGTASGSASYAGDANHASGTDSASFTIAKAASTVTVACEPLFVSYTGSALTPCSAVATGAGSLNQTLTPSYSNNINIGTASASAIYAGDANHTGSSGGPVTFTIAEPPPATTTSILSVAPSPIGAGVSYSVSYRVVAVNGLTPQGTVRVRDGVLGAPGTSSNTCPVSAGICALTSTAGGTKAITVAYSGAAPSLGSAGFAASAGTTQHTVSARNSSVTIGTIPSAVVGTPYSVPFTVTSECGAACGAVSGSVEVSDGVIPPVTCAFTDGAGSCAITSTSAATRTISVQFLGSPTFSVSRSTRLHTIARKTIAVTSLSVANAVKGLPNVATYSLTAPVAGLALTGNVTLTDGTDSVNCPVDPDGASGACSLLATTHGTGKTFTLTYAGDSNYEFATGSNTDTADTTKPAATVTYTLPAAGTVSNGQSLAVAISVTAPTTPLKPTGTVTVKLGTATCASALSPSAGTASCSLLAPAAGSLNVEVAYAGDSTFAAKTVTGTYAVSPAGTAVRIANVTPGSPTVGSPYAVLLTLTATYGFPVGTVSLTENGSTICSFASSSMVNNASTCDGWVATTAGSRNLIATFVPSTADFVGDTDTRSIDVLGAGSATAITAVSPASPGVGSSYAVTVQVTSATPAPAAGTVTLSDGMGGTQGTCDATWTPNVPATSHTITCAYTSFSTGGRTLKATFSGNSALNPSIGTRSVTIAKGAATVTIGTLVGPNAGAPSVLLLNRPYTVPVTVTGAGSTPTGSVTIANSAGGTCAVTLVAGAGSCLLQTSASGGTLTASYGGDVNYTSDTDTVSPVTLVRTPTVAAIEVSALNPSLATGVARGQQYLVRARVDAQPGYGTLSITGGTLTIRATSSLGTVSCTPSVTSNTAACYLTAPTSLPSPAELSLTAEYGGNATFAPSGPSTPAVTYPVR